MDKYYLGIDVGTSSLKIAALNDHLQQLSSKQIQYQYDEPAPNYKEIDPKIWLNAVIEGLRAIFQELPAEYAVAIGITGQMHTTVFLDRAAKIIRPAIMWNDTRTKDLVLPVKERLVKHLTLQENAKIISTGSPLINLLWLKDYEPLSFDRLGQVLMPVDYLVYCLTGNFSTDYCDASTTAYYDFTNDGWSKETFNLFDLPSEIFPPINAASTIVGELTDEMMGLLGIKNKIPVVAGTGDNATSALINRSFEDQIPLLSLGTSGVVIIPNENHQLNSIGKNVVVKVNPQDQTILTQGTVQAGAQLNSWWLEQIMHQSNFERAQAQISEDRLGKNSVLFFPHVNGEKTLFNNPDLRGAFVGLELSTTSDDLYQAVLEGVAFALKMLADAMQDGEKSDSYTIIGGGAKSKLWQQILANVFDCPMNHFRKDREAVEGAAMLAIIGTGSKVHSSLDLPDVVVPDAKIAARYQEKYQKYNFLCKELIN
ncbi:xylulokinase [Xylocopilactobacillus apicola]|nr:FGGY family carbohydrate kinase [Xylocopilactobacillus apicola]